jgi:hypothetical protein
LPNYRQRFRVVHRLFQKGLGPDFIARFWFGKTSSPAHLPRRLHQQHLQRVRAHEPLQRDKSTAAGTPLCACKRNKYAFLYHQFHLGLNEYFSDSAEGVGPEKHR